MEMNEIKRMNKMKDKYCRWCGEDLPKHSKECPLKAELKAFHNVKLRPKDEEYNLHLGRLNILHTHRIKEADESRKKVMNRLAYESTKFLIIRNKLAIKRYKQRMSEAWIKYFLRKKIKNMEDAIKEAQETVKIYDLPKKQMDDLKKIAKR